MTTPARDPFAAAAHFLATTDYRGRRIKERPAVAPKASPRANPNAPPEALERKWREEQELKRQASWARERIISKLTAEYPGLGEWLDGLEAEARTARLIRLGEVDLDLVGIAEELGLPDLPRQCRFIALEAGHGLIRRVQRRTLGETWEHASPWPAAWGGWDSDLDRLKLCLRIT